MCEECIERTDRKLVNQVISEYDEKFRNNPSMLIAESEVKSCLSRLMHGNCREELEWFGYEQNVGNFLQVLRSL